MQLTCHNFMGGRAWFYGLCSSAGIKTKTMHRICIVVHRISADKTACRSGSRF
jgi:hypothetical protein